MTGEYWTLAGPFGLKVRVTIRLAQFLLALITLSLQAADFRASAVKTNHIYAFVVSVLSIIIDTTHCLVTLKNGAWLILDACLVVLWAALAGTVGSTAFDGYEGGDIGEGKLSTKRRDIALATMAMGILSMFMWLASCFHGCFWCCARRRQVKATKKAISNANDMELNEA